jgi:HEPN domain-containing protein
MPVIQSSSDLRDLAEERLAEAKTLVAAGHYSGAFYLAGYVAELGLKAVLTRSLGNFEMPNQKEVAKAHTHDLKALAAQAGLEPERDPKISVDWNIMAPNWSPDDRYRAHTKARAEEMVDAAEEVLKWLKQHW